MENKTSLNANYFSQREHSCQIKVSKILSEDLPDFCQYYFIALQSRTSPLTQLNYAYDLRTFFNFLIKNILLFNQYKSTKSFILTDLDRITSYDIELYLSFLTFYQKKDGSDSANKERGKARKLSAVKSLYRYFFKRGDLQKDITTKVDTPKIHDKEIIRLERYEVNELLDAIETGNGLSKQQQNFHKITKIRDMAIVSLFLGTGIRVSELVGLNLSDIDMENNNFLITRKGGNKVILYLNPEVKQFLQEYLETRTTSLSISLSTEKAVFLSIKNTRLTTRAVENIIKKYAKVVTPLKKITPHKLRSTFGTELYRRTGDIYVVADVLGHKDVNTTKKHYAAITEDIRKKAASYVQLYSDDDSENNT